VNPDLIVPDWPAPPQVRALVTTRALGDMKTGEGRARLRAFLPADPAWIRQVHGTACVRAEPAANGISADAVYSKEKGGVCLVSLADCMPVLLAEENGEAVAAAHAGWRGLAGGVIESAIDALGIPGARLLAWLGPAIGPRAYEVGDEVRAAFLERDARAARAFSATRPGHWLLDLYAVARQRLEAKGVRRVSGGTFCTYTQEDKFFSFRKNGATQRMAAAVWLA
jgi:YfiH family protein